MLDLIRWLAILGGSIVVGLHMAVYANAERLTFHPKAWRLFILGNSILTIYAMWMLVNEKNGSTLYVVATSMLVTLLGILSLEVAYRNKRRQEEASVKRMERRDARRLGRG